MKNSELLEYLGFYKKDIDIIGKPVSFYCNPLLDGEAICEVKDIEDKSIEWMLKVITFSAHNNGWRAGREYEKKHLIDKLNSLHKKVIKDLNKV